MSTSTLSSQEIYATSHEPTGMQARTRRISSAPTPFRSSLAQMPTIDAPHHQAELFYLQKQIHAQTPMVVILEDGERIEGCIEWYDRNAIKVRGKGRTLIFKSAIKYMYKLGDNGTA